MEFDEREIKLQGWDKINKKMVRIENIDFSYKECLVTNGFDLYCIGFSDIILIQYTGFTDRNGKEIWDGHILKNQEGKLGAVHLSCGSFIINFVEKGEEDFSLTQPTLLFYNHCFCKIVGNIFENADLIRCE